jgi:hypothetical protein
MSNLNRRQINQFIFVTEELCSNLKHAIENVEPDDELEDLLDDYIDTLAAIEAGSILSNLKENNHE